MIPLRTEGVLGPPQRPLPPLPQTPGSKPAPIPSGVRTLSSALLLSRSREAWNWSKVPWGNTRCCHRWYSSIRRRRSRTFGGGVVV
jgi:hypothetical protein